MLDGRVTGVLAVTKFKILNFRAVLVGGGSPHRPSVGEISPIYSIYYNCKELD